MDYEIKFLGGTPFGTIHEAMTEAFADYLMDMSYMTKEVLWRRAMKNGVDFACSPGAFQDGRLVGLTLVGLGTWAGEPAAFDACTGIVKAHRGQGLAGRIFDAALPVLRGRGTTRFLLEVIQENEPAVKAYERTGFRITRPMVCYQRTDPRLPEASALVEIRPVGPEALDVLLPELDWQPSWENTFDAVRAVPDGIRLYGAFDGAACVGLVVYYPTLRWIMSLVVKRSHRGRGIGKSLLAHALRNVEPGGRSVRVNNVDASDLATVSVLQQCGFRELVSQYEMEFRLS
ncbi:MAG TPA: GNAT family N-acetyltransferase [Holophaga sp.]|nr:GNAT family N-acetyltransferase [Holophaga sp.]HPS68797.1 GNAT family N-acetyltransferase [Holophaga sp.]